MHKIKLDFEHGFASIDSVAIKVDEQGVLASSIAKLCSPPMHTSAGNTRYRLLKKASACGRSADCVIEIEEGGEYTLTLLFDLIEFFDSSILESKVLKGFEKCLNVKFISTHPSTAFLDSRKRGQAIFFYDAKQGDLSLKITFQPDLSQLV